jgi:cell wall-associated NlpC family hydrolase
MHASTSSRSRGVDGHDDIGDFAKDDSQPESSEKVSDAGREIVMYAMGLIDVGYVFGGKNPEAGLDCSGMVSFIYRSAVNMDLRGSAADIAKRGHAIDRADLQVGDLVFFNTMNRPYSHVGIYIGDGRFVHAPSSHGRIRIEKLDNSYFAKRFEEARTLFNS